MSGNPGDSMVHLRSARPSHRDTQTLIWPVTPHSRRCFKLSSAPELTLALGQFRNANGTLASLPGRNGDFTPEPAFLRARLRRLKKCAESMDIHRDLHTINE